MAADANGYYSALGLNAGAPIEAVRAAYRRLAKECHPDTPGCIDGGQRFRRIAEAHDALSDATFKTAYDSGSSAHSRAKANPPPPPKVEPIKCEVCGNITAQPRRLAFWRVTSFLLASRKAPIQRIFCHKCAAKEQWKSTIWTGLLGWWGVPWGPAWAIQHGFTNASGGSRQRVLDEALLWQNAVAFASRGEGSLAIGISNILRKSENAEVAQKAADIIRFFHERGYDAAATLKDVWKRSVPRTITLCAIAFAAPMLILTLMVLPSITATKSSFAGQTRMTDSASEALSSTFGTSANPPVLPAAARQSPSAPPEPTCAALPTNGQVLVNRLDHRNGGNKLEIDNGMLGDAIIKLRDATRGQTIASFFVAKGRSATLDKIPDGSYRIQYATGDKLRKSCRTFIIDDNASASEFPDTDAFQTRYQDVFDGTEVIHSKLTYTLYPVPNGTVRPSSIDMNAFDQP